MMQYATDAQTHERPWELWEVLSIDDSWIPCRSGTYMFRDFHEYRRKPRTININGYEVPEPVQSVLKVGTTYWTPSLNRTLSQERTWERSSLDYCMLRTGQVHTSRKAAELHAKALLSFTRKE